MPHRRMLLLSERQVLLWDLLLHRRRQPLLFELLLGWRQRLYRLRSINLIKTRCSHNRYWYEANTVAGCHGSHGTWPLAACAG